MQPFRVSRWGPRDLGRLRLRSGSRPVKTHVRACLRYNPGSCCQRNLSRNGRDPSLPPSLLAADPEIFRTHVSYLVTSKSKGLIKPHWLLVESFTAYKIGVGED